MMHLPTVPSRCFPWLIVMLMIPSRGLSLTPCMDDEHCRNTLHPASTCIQTGLSDETGGFTCSNPFANGGCLFQKLPEEHRKRKVRVCNSQDPPDALLKGNCRLSPMNYHEIRIQSNNWPSSLFISWVLQIILSELLDVPTSIETSFLEYQTEFYAESSVIDYGWSHDVDSLRTAVDVGGDCVPLTDVSNPEDYKACSHYIPEAGGSYRWAPELLADGIIEPTRSNGELGTEGWYVPLFTAKHDLSLLHHSGLTGEANRQKLAATFKRPLCWREYCDMISPDNCTTPDETVTRRYPDEGYDMYKYFSPGEYQGYFLFTEKNNCTLNPDTCTGHIVDYPCGWSSYVEPTLHHLNIALESNGPNGSPGGYWESQMKEIWHAANATRNHVMMFYYTPTMLHHQYLETEFAFQRITLPEPTQECLENRRNDADRCSEDPILRWGDPRGTCDEPSEVLQKIISKTLYDITVGPSIPDALKSPAYYILKEFTITDLQIYNIFDRYNAAPDVDKWHFGSRDAVCEWAVDNLDFLSSFIPETYPRVLQKENNKFYLSHPSRMVGICMAAIALASAVGATYATFRQRKRPVMIRAQVEFLYILLAGLVLVSLGSLTRVLPPTDESCIATIWLVNAGYSLELVPLVVKSGALNHIMTAGRRMKRVKLVRSNLFGVVFLITFLVLVMLLVWTLVDPPQQRIEYSLTMDNAEGGSTVVEGAYYCQSNSNTWMIVSISWQSLLLLIAAVLAFQNRVFREDVADTKTLAMMIYSHVFFMVIRITAYVLVDSLGFASMPPYQSIIFSCDVIATLVIFFLPKLVSSDMVERRNTFVYQNSNHCVLDSLFIGDSVRGAVNSSHLNIPRKTNVGPEIADIPKISKQMRDFLEESGNASDGGTSEEKGSSGETFAGDDVPDAVEAITTPQEKPSSAMEDWEDSERELVVDA